MSDAYIETTILTDLLLKPKTPKQARATAALQRFDETLLPVYSIKEWKAGPLAHFARVHDKLLLTGSLKDTLVAISIVPAGYRKSTSTEAIAAAAVSAESRLKTYVGLGSRDQDMADCYRYALYSLIKRSWRKRRTITDKVVDDLDCYTEVEPKIDRTGLLDLEPKLCEERRECCLAERLKSRPDLLEKLRSSIPSNSQRPEDTKRRQALKRLIKHPTQLLDRDDCRSLGDAIFAFFCPEGAVVLTTNIRDHGPLAESIGKHAEKP
jgi:hypothetical protein